MSECRRSTETFEVEKKGKTNRVLLNGYWIWWCYEHNQPVAWCENNTLKQQRDDLLDVLRELVNIIDGINEGIYYRIDSLTAQPAKAAIAKCDS